MRLTTRELVIAALLMGLTAVATMVLQIPVPATGGYINFGDTVIFATAIVFGPVAGLLAGGIGSALADLLSGYGQWAPFTLVVKGLEGLICGYLYLVWRKKSSSVNWMGALLSAAIAGLWMVAGYFLVGASLAGSFGAALAEVPGNLIQAAVSVVLGLALVRPLQQVAGKK